MRLPRFRISTLMLLVVIVALATALVVQQVQTIERERLQAEMARREAKAALRAANALLSTPRALAPPVHAGGTGAAK